MGIAGERPKPDVLGFVLVGFGFPSIGWFGFLFLRGSWRYKNFNWICRSGKAKRYGKFSENKSQSESASSLSFLLKIQFESQLF